MDNPTKKDDGMKGLATRIFWVIAFVVMMLACCEGLVRHYPNSYSLKAAWLATHAHEATTLVMGSSRSYYGINPHLLGQQAFSVANVSQNPEYDLFLLQQYYNNNKHQLRNVILDIGFTGLFNGPLEDDEWGRAIYYRVYMDYDKHSRWSRYGFECCNMRQVNKKFLPALRYLLTGHAEVNCDSLGFGIPTTRPDEVNLSSLQASADRVFSQYSGIHWEYVLRNRADLERVAAFCQQHGIQLFVVSTPVWQGYQRRIGGTELAVLDSTCRILSQKYGAVCRDYASDPRFSDIENFSDCSHLSRLGADRLTRILMEEFPQLKNDAPMLCRRQPQN